MAITAETRKSIVQLVVTAYNAAPGTKLLTDLVAASTGGASLADIATTLSTSDTFNSIYPTFQTATEFATEFLGNLVPEASAAAVAEGVAVIEGVLNGGGSRADVILQASTFLAALSETDASFGSSAANFNNKVEVAEHHTITLELDSTNITDLQNVLSSVTSDDATVAPAKAGAAAAGGESGETYTLTTGADALTGTAADDLFVATEATLSSADVLNGGGGMDALRYASSGTAVISESGFETSAIEEARITADSTGGTTFDVTGMTGLTSVTNNNSSQNLTLTGLSSSAGVTMTQVSGGNTIVQYINAALAGSSDTQSVTLTGNASNAGLPASQLWIGNSSSGGTSGIETLNIESKDIPSGLIDVVTAAPTINISGNAGLTIVNNLEAATKIDASTNTGGVSLKVDSGATDVAATGGTGNDSIDFTNGWDKGDSFNGGDGMDSLGLSYAVATAIVSTNTGSASNVEILDVNNAATANGTIDMDNFAGVTKVVLDDGINTGVTTTVDDAVTGLEVELDVDSATTGSLVVDLKTDGTSDALTVTLDRIGNAGAKGGTDVIASLNAADAETLTINADDDTTDGKGAVTITSLTASDATTINLTGDADVTITNTVDPSTPALKTLDASALTGKATISGTNFVKTGATIILGAGDDTLTFATADGADTITLGGGKDKLVYNAVAQSDSDTDTVKDFTSGSDSFAFNLGNPVLKFLGNKSSFGQSQGALSGGSAPTAGIDAVFQVDDQILWLDVNDDGTLDNNDWRIKLEGVTALTAADVGVAAGGNSITITAAAATVNATTKTNATNVTTNFNDTISTKNAFLNGSTIDGLIGTADVLTVTDALTVNLNNGGTGGTISNVESLTLANAANTIAFTGASGIKNVTGGTAVDTLTTANLAAGGAISLGDGNDVATVSADLAASTLDGGAGDDGVTLGFAGAATLKSITGGTGTDTLTTNAGGNDLKGVTTLSGFETLTSAGADTLKVAQINGFTTITNAGGITLSDGGTVTSTMVGTINTAVGLATTFTLPSGKAATINGNTGAETINVTKVADLTFTEAAAGGTDTLNLTGDNGGAITIPGLIEAVTITSTQTSGAITNGAQVVTFDASGISTALTIDDVKAAATSTKTGSGNDTLTLVTANTAASTIELGAGVDTVTALNVGAANMTLDFGSGNGTITDIAAKGAGVLTLKFGTPATGTTDAINIAATTANLAVNDIFDFATDVTGVVTGAADGTKGVAGAKGQVFIEQGGGNTTITFDADGSQTFTTGDTQITIVGNLVNGGIAGGNLVLGSSA